MVLSIQELGARYKDSMSIPSDWLTPLSELNNKDAATGFDAVIVSDIYMGAGLSSSASLECAVATLMEIVCGHEMDSLTKMEKVAQRAEHEWAKVPCGLMDQAICTLATENHALLFDCKSKTGVHAPIPADKIGIIVIDSGVKHALVEGEYKKRRDQCQKAVDMVNETGHNVKTIREVECSEWLDEAAKLSDAKDDLIWLKRGTHVFDENKRCVQFAEALSAGNFEEAGKLMTQSHASLRDLFETSTVEVDALVELCLANSDVLGARITGGGFGGGVVAMCRRSGAEAARDQVLAAYTEHIKGLSGSKLHHAPRAFLATPSQGCRKVDG
eukprot:GHVN01045845.1.p1 GENE.GHVN01045845.1~~GHVN01045845.1.p1  ORF type:complete len:329 (-),score=47.54 GHVN01045845.1:185-1171(-)